MKQSIYSVFIQLIFILLLAGISDAKTIKITNGNWPPFAAENLPHYGFASHIVETAFEQEQIQVQWEFIDNWQRALELAKEGTYDATPLWSYTSDRADFFSYSQVIAHEKTVFAYRRERPYNITQESDIQGLVIALTQSYDYGDLINSARQQKLFTPHMVPKDLIGLEMLFAKRVDLFPVDHSVGQYLLSKLGAHYVQEIVFGKYLLEDSPLYLLFSNKSAQRDFFLEKFNQGLTKIRKNGKLDEIYAKLKQGLYSTVKTNVKTKGSG